MKRNWFAFAVILMAVVVLAGCAVQPAGANTASNVSVNLANQQEGVWVTGQGEILVVPDIANISLGVSAQAKTVAEAQSAAATVMNKVMDALTQGGVAKKDIQTQQFSIQQVTRFDRDRQEEIVIGYRVTNIVNAKIRDINKAGTVIDAVTVAGGDLTRVNSISFDVDNPSAYYKEVREKAMVDAQTKAKQLADLGGITLGAPTYISESSFYPPIPRPVFLEKGAIAAPAVTTPISAGEMKITLNVQVVYAIKK